MPKLISVSSFAIISIILCGCAANQNMSRNTYVSQNNSLDRLCRAKYASAMLTPTQSGSFFESYGSANEVYESCMAGLPDPRNNKTTTRVIVVPERERIPNHTTCMPNGVNIECETF